MSPDVHVAATHPHVTDTKGLAGGDFEKGEAQGAADALMILETLATALLRDSDPSPATS